MSVVGNRVRGALLALAAGAVLLVGLPHVAEAAPVQSAPVAASESERVAVSVDRVGPMSYRPGCGYNGYNGDGNGPYYTHCGNGLITLKVTHFFWVHTYQCVGPGRHEVSMGGSDLAIVNAVYDHDGC